MFAARKLICFKIYVPLVLYMGKSIKFDALVNHLPGMVYRCFYDRGLTLVFASEQCVGLTGYSTSSLLGNPPAGLAGLAYRQDRDRLILDLQTQLQENKSFSLEYRLYTADSQLKWVCNRGLLVTDEDENKQYLEGIIFDITSIHEQQDSLRASEERFRRTVDELHQPVDIINTLANLCLLSLAEGSKHFAFLEEKLNKIIDQGERMAAVTHQARLFMHNEDSSALSIPEDARYSPVHLDDDSEIPLVCDQSESHPRSKG